MHCWHEKVLTFKEILQVYEITSLYRVIPLELLLNYRTVVATEGNLTIFFKTSNLKLKDFFFSNFM